MLGRVAQGCSYHVPRSSWTAVKNVAQNSLGRAATHSRSAATAVAAAPAAAAAPALTHPVPAVEQVSSRKKKRTFNRSQLSSTQKHPALLPPEPSNSVREGSDRDKSVQLGFPVSDLITLVDEISLDPFYLQKAAASLPIITLRRGSTHVIKTAEYLASRRRPHRSLNLLELLHAVDIRLPKEVYHAVAHQFALRGIWHLMPALAALEKAQFGRITSRMLNWRIRAQVELQEYGQLKNGLDEFVAEGAKPTRRTFHMLAAAHLRNHDPQRAQAILKQMEETGFPVDASTHIWISSAYRTIGTGKEVSERAIGALATANDRSATIVMNGLIQAALDQGDSVRAFRVLDSFNQAGLSSSRGLVVPVHTPGGLDSTDSHVSSPQGTSSLPTAQPGIPAIADTATYTLLINHMAHCGNLARAQALYQQMIASGLSPDTRVIAALLRAYYATGDASGGVSLVEGLFRSSPLTRSCFNAIRYPQQHVPPNYHFPLSAPGVQPDTWLLNALLQCSLEHRGINVVGRILYLMDACDTKPDSNTLTIFLRHLASVEKARPRELIRAARAILRSGLHPTQQQYDIILGSIIKESRKVIWGHGWSTLAAIHSPTRRAWHKHRATIVNRLPSVADRDDDGDPSGGVDLPKKLQYRALAQPLLEMLRARGVRADSVTSALRIQHQAVVTSDPEGAWVTLTKMLETGWQPTAKHFATLMEGYTLVGEMGHAAKVMRTAERAGVHSTLVMHTIMIAGYARAGKPQDALRAFDAMLTTGIRPDTAAVDALCSAYFAVGRSDVARRLLLELWPLIKPFPDHLKDAPLRDLVMAFRSSPKGTHEGGGWSDFGSRSAARVAQPLSQQRARLLRWKVRRIVDVWSKGNTRGRRWAS